MPPLRIQEITNIDELTKLRRDWTALWERRPDATPFHAPEWILPWWSHLFGGGEMWTLAVWRGDRLAGLAPLFIYGCDGAPRTVASIGSGVTDYLGFLVEDAGACGIIANHLAGHARRWDVLDFQEIPPSSPLPLFPAECRAESSVSGVCPVVELPETMEQFEAGLTPKFRHNLRNARSRLRNLGDAAFETAGPGQDAEYLDALFRLHRSQWESRDEPGMLSTAALQAFYCDVAREFRHRGWLRLHGLRVCGELRAVIYLFVARRRVYSYLS